MRNQFKRALLAAALSSNIGALATVTLTSRVAVCYPSSVSVTTYTTTGTNGIASIVTSSTTLPAPPPGSVSVTSFVTTGTNGIVSTVTSSTTLPPPPPPASASTTTYTTTRPDGIVSTVTSQTTGNPRSVSISTFTTTGTNGIVSTVTSSTTAPAPPPPPPPPSSTSATTYVTTNPAGSIITTSRTTVIPPPPISSTSTAAVAYYSQACGGRYSDNLGQIWCLQCQTAYYYNDLTTVTVGSFEDCLESCDTYVPSPDVAGGASCIAVTWGPRTVGGECYRKFNVTDSRLDPREDSAYKCDQAAPPPSASSLINTNTADIPAISLSTPATSRPNVPVSSSNPNVPASSSNPNVLVTSPRTSSATSAGNLPATSNPPVPVTTQPASSPGAPPATLISSSTTATSVDLRVAYQPCPSSDGQQFIDTSGTVYDIRCGCDFPYSDLGAATHQDYFQNCLQTCDRYVPDPNSAQGAPCIGVAWGRPDRNAGGNCYMKYRIESVKCGNPDFCAATKHTYTIPPGVLSSSPAASTATVVPVSSSTSNVQPPVVVSSSSTTLRPSASSSTSFPAAVVPPSSTQSTLSPTNTFAPPQISGTFSCPGQNGSIYTDKWGQQWETRCGQDINGRNSKSVHADSWEKCLEFADITGGAVGVTYPGGGGDINNALAVQCYPYNVFTNWVPNQNPTLCAARPLNLTTGNFFNTVSLCPSKNNELYTDSYSRTYQIRCAQLIGGTNLAGTVTYTFNACVNYCSTYNTCTGVVYTDFDPNNDRVVNCQPVTGAGVSTVSASTASTSCAQLVTN
ncbi:MAG: hypothetical protein Q9168_008222 [Polycauliona sp. 1 TL-2023]